MLIPVRCFTCGSLIADKYSRYQEGAKAGRDPAETLASLGVTRYCCRRMLLTSVETIRQVIPFYEAIQRRKREIETELE
ncbi:MAG: DNA-directed RNA polymerase subunit N [Nitrosopumilus sp.]|nr:DNA-directed RNA polymerase subunit N [Nitrosopumilus sp.]CAI9831004.1 DNA-directed RNA polymerase subunit N [Nitrosopumilaceae archaeon]MDA7941706.1 DNA-directed RNA polymerase subunit N [Nitrosopumilus sp.]MDA7944000.1 DNA-directed RNA polymerase subunit N [Nitrosopumilus sp.]MDA7944972.1 DNA-directed RNA polymerase subunit N [Nitrosopumilus sp.]